MLRWATVKEKGGPDCHAAVAVGHQVYTFGGSYMESGDRLDVHVINTVSLHWAKVLPLADGTGEEEEAPSLRRGSTAVLVDDAVYVWGGWDKYARSYCNALYVFNVDTHRWSKPRVSGAAPEGRCGHSACVRGKAVFVHGGNKWNEYDNDVHRLNTATMVWSRIVSSTGGGGVEPPPSEGHSATVIGTEMIVFGGYNKHYKKYYNNVRVFDTESSRWLNTPTAQLLPEGRVGHAAFPYRGELYVLGGHTRLLDRVLLDHWSFNLDSFSWRRVEPRGHGPAHIYAMSSCLLGEQHALLVGGVHTPGQLYVLDMCPTLRFLCKLAVLQYGLEQPGLPHNVRCELAAMMANNNSEIN